MKISTAKQLETPVLFILFNRPDTTARVFESIREVKPVRLYLACDGPRCSATEDPDKVEKVRSYVTSNIDWPCQVRTLFSSKNHGCKLGVSAAISWFFEHEEMGIILEDDCLPSRSFFFFCENLLKKYADDSRIWHIAGSNFHFGWQRDPHYSYYFSYYGSIWGWATWRRAWKHYSVDMEGYSEIKSKNYLWDIFGDEREKIFREQNFDQILNGLDTWDFQWAYTRFINSAFAIIPSVNLVSNIGFGQHATHTTSTGGKWADMERFELEHLHHPFFVIRDKQSDDRFIKNFLKKPFYARVTQALRRKMCWGD